jgi:multicomponent Na+:H+ antiporter subunit F
MFLDIIIGLITVSAILSSYFIFRGKNKWERLLGLTLASSKINMLIIIFALMSERSYYLEIALIYTILSYIGIKVLTDFMSGRKEGSK